MLGPLPIPIALLLLATTPAAAPVDFAREVAPVLERSCVRCHNPGNAKGGVSVASLAALVDGEWVVPGRAGESPILDVLTPEGPSARPRMPKEGEPLSDAERDALRRWIDEGARWPEGTVVRERPRAGDDWWSLLPVAASEPPPDPTGWASNPIDRFLVEALAAKGLRPSGPADRRTLIRRLSFDLNGLPPTPEEVRSFEDDPRPDAYERLVDRLLASPRYGERWGRHWLDVVRFGESTGFERNVIIDNAWPFRDYVIRSFNEDKPFDRLILEHLAGDVVGAGDPAVEVGTGFLVCGPYDNVGNQDAVQSAQIRANTIDDIVRAAGETFLGLTIGCARCHDHKFDPILQADYYALYGTFAGVHHGAREVATAAERDDREARLRPAAEARRRLARERDEFRERLRVRAEEAAPEVEPLWVRPAPDRYGTEDTFPPLEARHVRLVVTARDDAPDQAAGFQIEEFEVWTAPADGRPPRNVALATEGGTARGPSREAGDFAGAYGPALAIDGKLGTRWIAAGQELTITLGRPEVIGRVRFYSDGARTLGPRHPHTRFVGEYRIDVSADGQSWTTVAGSADRTPASPAHRARRLLDRVTTDEDRRRLATLDAEVARLDAELAAVPPLPSWWIGQFRQAPGPFPIFLGGDPQKKGPPAPIASLAALGRAATPYRLEDGRPEAERRLALARWLADPRNPLVPRVLANRIWHYHFGTGIVDTPSDFGFMGGRPSHPALLDWLAARLVADGWRLKPLHRLIVTSSAYRQASAYRAEAAAVDADDRLLWRFPPRRLDAEEVRDAMLSASGRLDQRMGGPGFRLYRYLEDNVATYVPLDRPGPETYRRGVYHQNARAAPVDLMAEFDCPDNAFAAPRRASTTSPLQALTLLNHKFTLDMAAALADRLAAEAGGEGAAPRVERAFRLAFGRGPTAAERDAAARLVGSRGLRALARALFNANEFLYVD